MKTYFLLSETNIGLIISGAFALATLLLTLVIIPLLNRVLVRQKKSLEQMDGHMTTLIQTTAELNKVIGNQEGRAERKEEQAPIVEQKVKDAEELGKLKGKEELRDQINNGDKSKII